METGSNYLTVEGSSDSLIGLKFGQKIYFEDGTGGGGGGSGKTAVSSGGGGAAKKGGKTAGQSGQPPRCQVEGCDVDLSDAKAYYSRHKVCGMHSKSSTVIVNGLEQRFCQQCSRFHQLPEFDQGKRSCRRRLAGHNERRRKPPPGSLLSSRLGRLSSSVFADNNRSGFLLDFSSYPRHSEKDSWLGSESSEQVSGSQSRSIIWPGSSEEHPSKMYLQGSASGSNFSYTSGECITGVSSDSSCALSLLSNQTWSVNKRSPGTGPSNPPNMGGECITGLSADSSCALSLLSNQTWGSSNASSDTVTVAQFPSNGSSWGFKGGTGNDGANSGLHDVPSGHLGLGQFSQPHFSGHYHGDLMMEPVHGGRQYMDVNSSRAYDSANSNLVDWSL